MEDRGWGIEDGGSRMAENSVFHLLFAIFNSRCSSANDQRQMTNDKCETEDNVSSILDPPSSILDPQSSTLPSTLTL